MILTVNDDKAQMSENDNRKGEIDKNVFVRG